MKDSGDYISSKALLSAVEGYGWKEGLKTVLKRIPAADVRPVVLCRECKYYYKDAYGYEMCDNSEGYDHVSEDGFCAWAVKREES